MRPVHFSKRPAPVTLQFVVCIADAPGAPLPDHVHLVAREAGAPGRIVAQAPMRDRELRIFRKAGINVLPAKGLGPAFLGISLHALTCEANTMRDPSVRQAASIILSADSEGRIHIEFYDAAGLPFAGASMDADEFSRLIGDGCDVLEIVAKGGLALEPHAGVA